MVANTQSTCGEQVSAEWCSRLDVIGGAVGGLGSYSSRGEGLIALNRPRCSA
jgi:hypothetical protein